MGRNENRREVPEQLIAVVAVGLLTSGTVRVDPEDPATIEALRVAAEKVCAGLFPVKAPKGSPLGFGTLAAND